MKLNIKNMVCPRCVMAVEGILSALNIKTDYVRLGEVELAGDLTISERKQLALKLEEMGFELLDDKNAKVIEQVKSLLIQNLQEPIENHFSIRDYLTQHIFRDYSFLSKLFSQTEGITLEQYFILQKTEKAKELILYDQMSLGEIAAILGYSSSQHLSAQFKRITGMTPTKFKSFGHLHRRSIDSI